MFVEREMKTYLKIKIKSLVAENAIILKEQEKWNRSSEIWRGLCGHRIGIIRNATRNSLVAYGFLRGRGYRQIENTTKTEPGWSEVERLILKYGEGDPRNLRQLFSEWKDAA